MESPQDRTLQIRHHLARALFHLNHLAGLIPFFVFEDEVTSYTPVTREPNLVRWSDVGRPTMPASSSSSMLFTHGQLPRSMVMNPEPNLRPLSLRDHLSNETPTLRGRNIEIRPDHPDSTPATGSGDPIPMAAARPAKRPRCGRSPPPLPASTPAALPDIDPLPAGEARDLPVALPVASEDSASEAEPAPPEFPDRPAEEPPAPRAPTPSNPPPRIGHTSRGWAPVDDNDLVALKKDTRARHSWKAIGHRLHRDPDSCRARWYWLKSSRPELSTPAVETED